ncbi:MAG: 3-deoxy-D-manno-octulosonic acid transferase [Panacagrimonas sp.]|nr:lipid IV(A) 3-deoxy-D-manno-octulosonic acid transferase [Panacagrimonas sp.]MCC2658146.1 3-deoxy-D-manno-octulosonic acid transferase [Panacagrimonas sp.]
MRALYLLLLYLVTPLVLLRLLWRSRQLRGYRERLGERFGLVTPAPRDAEIAVWVHAVSVGETMAALPLIRRLVERHGERRVWVTTTTPTGSERVRAELGDKVIHTYAPYDLPGSVGRFLDRARPRQVVILETELWPTLFRALRRRNIPLTIANARLSPRSFNGYSRVAGFTHDVLSDTTRVAAQSQADAQRFAALGAPNATCIGNLKFDIDPPAPQIQAGQALRARLVGAQGPPVWIAASTHEGEEAAAIEAHRRVRMRHPDALLLLVPRHPQRFDEVVRRLEHSGLAFERRTRLDRAADDGAPGLAVLLGDSLGEMWMYLSASDVAFVGGSLVPVGGHNVLEPAALGLPVLFGPHMHNFIAARDLLLGCASAVQVGDGEALARSIVELLDDPARRARMGEAGRVAVMSNRGALEKLLALLD